jgi:phage protein D
MLTGEIKSLRPTFPASGQPTLAISGLNLLDQLRRRQVSHTYEKVTDSQIAQQIATRIGADVKIDQNAAKDEQQYPYLFQENQYDILFLWERARRIGYDLFVVEPEGAQSNPKPKFFFGPSTAIKRPTYRLSYGRSLTQFQPDLTTTNQVSAVTVRGWNAKTKQKIEATVTRKQIDNKGVTEKGGQAQIDKSFENRREVIATKPVADKAEAEKLARETLERIAKDMVKGSGATVGLPDLRAGSVVQIDGLGDRFSGRYFVTGTTHTMGDGGYTTQFECRREET